MSKLSNMLRMVLILNKNDNVKIADLAHMLEVSPRQIRRYRDELEFSGIYIESLSGKHGGYTLQDKTDSLSITSSITKDEENLIHILTQDNFGDIRLLYKMFKEFNNESNMSYLEHVIPDHNSFYAYSFIYKAKEEKQKVKVLYRFDTRRNLTIEKTIHPYITFRKYGQHYLYAFDEYQNKMIKLLLSKFKSWELTGDKFERNEKLYESCRNELHESSSVYKGEKEYIVEANVWEIERDIIERILECKIDVTYKSRNFQSIRFKTSNLSETKRKLLMFGHKVAVWEPFELKKMILSEVDKLKQKYIDRQFYNEYGDYVKQVEKHLTRYIAYNYGNVPYHHVISKKVPVYETFLRENREIFKKYQEEIGDLHSPRNFKSSQMMTLDFFLKYKETDKTELNNLFNIKEKIIDLHFEKIYKDYTNVDIVLSLEDNAEVIIECKYTEDKFDRIGQLRKPKQEHYDKFNGKCTKCPNIRYKDLNQLMTKSKITTEDMFDNYQLWRNLYTAFTNNKNGYFFVIMTRSNPKVNNQFDLFYDDLLNKYGFKYIDRVKKFYWEDLASNDMDFLGKYIFIKDSRINLDIIETSQRLVSDLVNKQSLIEFSGLNKVDNKENLSRMLELYKDTHDIVNSSVRNFKKYDNLIDIKHYI